MNGEMHGSYLSFFVASIGMEHPLVSFRPYQLYNPLGYMAGPQMLEQDTRDAFDLIILARDGAKPEYECRIAPNDQVNTIIGQMRRVHPQLQRVQPYTLIDYQFTLPADPNFA